MIKTFLHIFWTIFVYFITMVLLAIAFIYVQFSFLNVVMSLANDHVLALFFGMMLMFLFWISILLTYFIHDKKINEKIVSMFKLLSRKLRLYEWSK